MKAKNRHVFQMTTDEERYEWYTPRRYVSMAYDVLGKIDFDPCSSEFANQTVQATTYYTRDDNALVKPWPTVETVWMNPPYNRSLLSALCSSTSIAKEHLYRVSYSSTTPQTHATGNGSWSRAPCRAMYLTGSTSISQMVHPRRGIREVKIFSTLAIGPMCLQPYLVSWGYAQFRIKHHHHYMTSVVVVKVRQMSVSSVSQIEVI